MKRYQVECEDGTTRLLAWVPREDCVAGKLIDAPCPRTYLEGDKRFLRVESVRMRVLRAYPNCGIEERRDK